MNSDNNDKMKNAHYKREIVIANSRNMTWILIFASVASAILLFLNVSGLVLKDQKIHIVLVVALYMAVSMLFVLEYFKARASQTGKYKKLFGLLGILYLINLVFGTLFTVNMFRLGRYTYSMFYVSALIISTSNSKKVYLGTLSIVLSYIVLNLILYFSSYFGDHYLYDILESAIVVLFICFINSINTRQYITSLFKTTEIKKMNSELLKMSESDHLTGVYNRRKAIKEIEAHIEYAKRYETNFCVAMLDIDKFKRINDRYGHSAGDSVLKEITDIIQENLRENDLLARWGGEEFAIIIPNADEQAAFNLINRIRKIVQDNEFDVVGNVTFSAGVCEYINEYTVDNVIDKADFALYLSKQMGRNKVSIFKAA